MKLRQHSIFLMTWFATGHECQVYESDVVIYNTPIDGLWINTETEKATYFLNVMIFEEDELNVITYNILSGGLCKKAEIEKSLHFVLKMILKDMHELWKKVEIKKASDFQNLMISKGHQLNVNNYIYGLLNKCEAFGLNEDQDFLISRIATSIYESLLVRVVCLFYLKYVNFWIF